MQFAIRPNLRNHANLTRELVIKLVASGVGLPHRVDLKNPELIILVEIYKVRTINTRATNMKRAHRNRRTSVE